MNIVNTSFALDKKLSNKIKILHEKINLMKILESQRSNQFDPLKMVFGSLAIEGSSLSISKIKAIADGKLVIASPREVYEAKNALAVYQTLTSVNELNQQKILDVHLRFMGGISRNAGQYRTTDVCVATDDKIIYEAPEASSIPKLMKQLFEFLEKTKLDPLIYSSIFHYEIERIHPFDAGNGLIGRFFQTLILRQSDPVFLRIPTEYFIYQNCDRYYEALDASNKNGDSEHFVIFMLSMIEEAVVDMIRELDDR